MKAKYIAITAAALFGGNFLAAQTQQPAPLPAAYPANAKINYIRNWQALRPGLDNSTIELQLSKDVKQSTEYVDGLGRSLQSVAKGASLATGGTSADVVAMHLYDNLGREVRQYLPYTSASLDGNFKQDPFAGQAAFMQGQYGPQGETFFYGQTELEASPLARPLKKMAPGNSWIGSNRGVQTKYWYNTLADSVRIWSVSGTVPEGTFDNVASTGIYPAGELQKNVGIDEHGKQVIEFKDKEGRVVLKKLQLTAITDNGNGSGHWGWLCTYYVYDTWGNPVCVLQPKAVEKLTFDGWQLTAVMVDELCFRYAYDGRNRIVLKKVPGAGEMAMIYDGRNRPVLTQDANLRGQGKWAYTQYDALERPVATGLWTTAQTAEAIRIAAANSAGDYPLTNSSDLEELTRTFYDGYGWLVQYNTPLLDSYNTLHNTHLVEASNSDWPYAQAPIQSNLTKGMVTGSRTKVLGTPDTYLYSVTIYDDKGRTIQTQSTNTSGGTDIVTTQYSWAGQPLMNMVTHQKAGTAPQTGTIVTKLTYDEVGRLAMTEKKMAHSMVNGGAMPGAFTTVAVNEYDVLGQLQKKNIGMTSGPPLESLTYDYNIRGWMLGTNRDYVKGMANNFFGFELGYDKAVNIISGQTYTNPQYNGNISGSTWKAAGDGEKRKYDFGYDAANRLMCADFNQYTSNAFNKTAGMDFSASGLYYDANGNILGMAQKGFKVGGSSFIDQMRYDYLDNSNKLKAVFDTANDNASKLGDFKYDIAAKTAIDYGYDPNGNLISDNNKKISGIAHNHLNLPQTVTVTGKGTIEYQYDALGNKLKKIVHETGNPDKTTDYLAGFIYEDGQLQFTGHEEGRIRLAKQYYLGGDSAWTLQYDYFLKDHLGNIRTVLTAQKDTARYAASFETGVRAKETALFTNIAQTAYPINLIQNPTYPADNTTSPNSQTSKLDGVNKQLGATLALKVMAGDKVDIGVKAWVPFAATAPDGKKITTTQLLSGLISALTNGASGLSGGKASPTELQNTGSPMLTGIDSFLNSHNDFVYPSPPRAYLNWILFDEQFKYVPSGSGFIRVGYYEDTRLQTLAQNALPIAKSGYLFVYLSNEVAGSETGVNVFFDNLTVQHYTGPLVEETQYYPFGLAMAGINSKAVGRMENKKKFNGYEENKSFDLNWLESFYRTYDPQLGRFWQVDPKPTDFESVYAAMGNNPIRNFDLLGDTLIPKDKSNYMIGYQPVFNSGSVGRGAWNALGNCGTFIYNCTAGLFMSTAQAMNNGVSDMVYGTGDNTNVMASLEQWQTNQYKYHTETPLSQQGKDLLAVATDLRSYHLPALLLVGHTLSLPGGGTSAGGLQGEFSLKSGLNFKGNSVGNPYAGVREASAYLRSQGVPRVYRKEILQSFERETISLRTAGNDTYGLRFYGGAANQDGRYLFPTFTNYTSRAGLALPPQWNSMTRISQFRIATGTPYIYGRAASQGGVYTGGSHQIYVNNIVDLIR